MKRKGVLHVLKKGLPVDDAHFTLMYPAPLASSAQKVHDNFAANIWSVTRQVHHSLANPNESVDMVLFLNGLPIVTLELKNAWTGQTARYHGQKQYRERDASADPAAVRARAGPHDRRYGRGLDGDQAGRRLDLVPALQQGPQRGRGQSAQPQRPQDRLSLGRGVPAREASPASSSISSCWRARQTDPLAKKTLIFPRYQQLDVVRKLLAHAAGHGVGHSYLIQHSAGSGKSNSITWAAYQLIETYPERLDLPGARALDAPLFDSVIVVTDRRLLDKQLRDNIRDFSEVKNIVAPAMRSADLKAALENGKKIIITTIQKFPFIIDGIADLSDKRFAVIIDEAHSGQSGLAHDKMNQAMGGGDRTRMRKIRRTRSWRRCRRGRCAATPPTSPSPPRRKAPRWRSSARSSPTGGSSPSTSTA